MQSSPELKVFPKKPTPLSTAELNKIREESAPGLGSAGCGCVTSVVICMFVLGFLEEIGLVPHHSVSQAENVAFGVSVIALIVTIFAYNKIRGSRIEKGVVDHSKRESADSIREAENVRAQSVETLKTISETSKELPNLIMQARKCLDRAEAEFQARAFGPFWDAIEEGARRLDDYYNSVNDIRYSVESYYHLLQGYNHTFPSLRTRISPPSPKSIVDVLQATVRKAQTDFEFATIWEHRQTREVLIAGFEHLGDALYNIGDVLSNSFRSLEDALRSEAASSFGQHQEHREAARMATEREIKILEEIRDK